MAGSATFPLSTLGAYVDLGAAPVMVQAFAHPVRIAIADSAPANNSDGFQLAPDMGPKLFYAADGSSHVWAASIGGPARVVASIASAI